MIKIYPLLLSISLLVLSACDRNPLSAVSGYESPPAVSAQITPDGGAWVARSGAINNTITVQFDASMDTTTLTVSGTMGTATYLWSTTTLTDDTLTIIPSTCPLGQGATLIITCDSLEGANITLNRTYNIAESVCYVNVGNTTGPWDGTRDNPMDTIQDAIDFSVCRRYSGSGACCGRDIYDGRHAGNDE